MVAVVVVMAVDIHNIRMVMMVTQSTSGVYIPSFGLDLANGQEKQNMFQAIQIYFW